VVVALGIEWLNSRFVRRGGAKFEFDPQFLARLPDQFAGPPPASLEISS
jgi:hypothetical protein